ncbi:hypothetical protein [Streptomyces inhibens]|uniref:hypothetical protein n=1 Tax=Streptomyces inhibens TaxID=2293571 RepID=UPI001EE6D327|nr:hypothetical protein [Streptomyces inhibens]UKY47800.1 hypothetical protein KI385_02425 [Streptomyces inhibens]
MTKKTRRIFIASLAILGCVGVTAGALCYGGVYDNWRDDQAMSRACDGVLPQGEIKQLLGSEHLREDARPKSAEELLTSCRLRVSDDKDPYGTISVTVGWSGGASDLLLHLDRQVTYSGTSMLSPIGNGWRGVLNATTPANPKATVVLSCDNKKNDSLVVQADAFSVDSYGMSKPDQQARFARFTTGTAKAAAAKWGCKTALGRKVRNLPMPLPTRRAEPLPARQAKGTCAGLAPDTPVVETGTSPDAPVEDCFVNKRRDELARPGNDHGSRQYRLAAYYGPFVNAALTETSNSDRINGPSGSSDGVRWITVDCPTRQGGTALFTIESIADVKRSPSLNIKHERAALKAFATKSAARHGCQQPQY